MRGAADTGRRLTTCPDRLLKSGAGQDYSLAEKTQLNQLHLDRPNAAMNLDADFRPAIAVMSIGLAGMLE